MWQGAPVSRSHRCRRAHMGVAHDATVEAIPSKPSVCDGDTVLGVSYQLTRQTRHCRTPTRSTHSRPRLRRRSPLHGQESCKPLEAVVDSVSGNQRTRTPTPSLLPRDCNSWWWSCTWCQHSLRCRGFAKLAAFCRSSCGFPRRGRGDNWTAGGQAAGSWHPCVHVLCSHLPRQGAVAAVTSDFVSKLWSNIFGILPSRKSLFSTEVITTIQGDSTDKSAQSKSQLAIRSPRRCTHVSIVQSYEHASHYPCYGCCIGYVTPKSRILLQQKSIYRIAVFTGQLFWFWKQEQWFEWALSRCGCLIRLDNDVRTSAGKG